MNKSSSKIINKNDIYIHDDILHELQFHRLQKKLNLVIQDFKTKNIFEIEFINTIGFEMTSCDFWGSSPRMNGLAPLSTEEYIIIPKLFEMKKKCPNSYSFLTEPDNYIEIIIEFISGDQLLIACEEIIVDDRYFELKGKI